ncbi:transcriptional regulator Dnr, partial [Ramlibacter sp. WS9]|uniref:transcriptional regulator Dnr n=1 Tax=Ramlibacter sp. WS9 TaxID=1882741 RepID=UPI001141708A
MEFQRVHQQLLQSHHLFEPLSPVQLQELLASSDLVNLDKGAYVFRQGEPAHAFYYLISGCVKIYRLTPEGQEKILEVTNERNTFAEAMMFMDTPNYVATAQAVVPSQLFRFSNKAYLRQLQDNTPLALALLAKLSTRLHQRIDEIETLSLKNATHRVVRYLLTLAAHAPGENCRVEIPVAKHLVAGHLSIQPETFSRIM